MFIRVLTALAFCAAIATVGQTTSAQAEDAATIESKSRAALQSLVKKSEDAALLKKDTLGILVFPEVLKGGLIVGGLYGEGALLKSDKATGYYETVAASIGLQAGIQKFGYAVFFMNEKAMGYLDESEGWEIGSAPSLVVVDKGIAGKFTTTSARESIYVFYFDQKGLMGGLGIEGTKISKITPE
ncbi:YSC84-related protein [Pelagibius marinus]|uniref:lipid-binding SYLF domain-containing protein n=1 Tax=Pelagibius marinus TaxID=2762760 RepID=UPI00187255E7|nr:YSC84-related protein [Pelagibius marinus]